MLQRPPATSSSAPVTYERGVAQQPDDGLGHFVGAAGTAQRRRRAELGGALRLAAARVDLGVDQAGAHRVDAHALRAEFLCETDGQVSTAPFEPA